MTKEVFNIDTKIHELERQMEDIVIDIISIKNKNELAMCPNTSPVVREFIVLMKELRHQYFSERYSLRSPYE